MSEVQDIFRQYGAEFLQNYKLNSVQMKAFDSILNCRTAALGSHVDSCNKCGHQVISYNSCKNRHCPKCQTLTKEKWIEHQEKYLLNVGYFHVVFTVPAELNALMLHNQEIMYNLFFKAVSETLLELGQNTKFLGAKLGATTILHTWGQNLMYHPHIHCVVPGGGLTPEGKWVYSRKKFFIPVKVLAKKFRGKFLDFVKQSHSDLKFLGNNGNLCLPGHFESYISGLYRKNWIVYCKPPFKNASKVIKYLGRYTHRVAISNNRIIAVGNGKVTFRWRDYADGNKTKNMTVSATEFIRRFMLHVLPKGFRKIRHYGLLASRDKTNRLTLCQKLTKSPVKSDTSLRDTVDILRDILGENFNLCPKCGVGYLIRASPYKSAA